MAKISAKVSGGLGAAIQEAQAQISGTVAEIEGFPGENTVEALLNSGAETQKKRKRRTKAEMEAARQAEVEESNSLFDSFNFKEEPKPKNHEEFCELELKKAAERGVENPDFDFRNFYEQGETVYYVSCSERLGEKEIHKVFLRTIYPRMMVGSEEKAGCHCIGYNDRDNVFRDSKTANDYYKSLEVAPRYTPQEPKLEEDDVKSTDEEVTKEKSESDQNMSSQEV